MPKRIEYDGKIHEFPDDFTDDEIRKALDAQQPTQQSTQSAAQEPEPTFMGEIGKIATQTGKDVVAMKDLLAGVGAGVFSTLHGTGKLLGYDSPYLKELATPPDTAMGKTGKYLEQGAEYLVPGMGAARGAALLRNAPRVAQIAGRAGMEAVGAGATAALQSGGDPEAVRNAALLGGGASAVVGAAPMVAPALREAAVTQYGRFLNPTKEKFKRTAQRVIPELIQRREWTMSMPRLLNRAQDRMRFFGQQIDDVWQGMEQTGTTAQIDPIVQRLDDVAREHFFTRNAQGQPVQLRGSAEAGFRELQGMAQTMMEASQFNPATGAREIPIRTLRELRQYWDEVADKSGAFTKRPNELADWARGRAARYGGDAVRAELAQATPNLTALNQEFSFWRRVGDVAEETVARRTGQQKPLTRQLMRAAGVGAGTAAGSAAGGVVGGGLGAVLGGVGMEALQTMVSSPAWRTIAAVNKDRLANALAAADTGAAQFYLNQLLRQAGMPAVTGRSESGAKARALPAAP